MRITPHKKQPRQPGSILQELNTHGIDEVSDEKQLTWRDHNMQELEINEIEVVSGENMPESSVGGTYDWS